MDSFDDPLKISIKKDFWIKCLRIIAFIPTAYLTGSVSFLAFLAVVFTPYSGLSLVEILLSTGKYFVPMFTYATIGVAGMKLVGSGRFWPVGLFAILVEIALAVFAHANPGSIPMFTSWIL